MRPRTDKIPTPDRHVELLELIGATLGGKYKLERLLGAGGMGGVYAASPVAGGATVAIKVLSVADPAARARIAGRFAREARAVSALKCPYIVTVVDAGSEDRGGGDQRPYLVMELLEGEDLGQRLRRDGRIPLRDTLHVAAQILVALGAAHEAGVIHRDLKPDNVFLSAKDGDPCACKLLDFGMSKLTPRENQTLALALTKKGMAVGTPFYMAPEQARAAEDVDGRVDLWALGAIMFECLTGRPPFVGSTQEQILLAICTTDAPDVRALQPEVPSKVAKLIGRALARDRSQRFLSAWQMLSALVELAPAEGRLLPANTFTAMDVRSPLASGGAIMMPPSSAPRLPPDASSGPFPAQPQPKSMPTIAVAPLPPRLHGDASGPHGAVRVSRPMPAPPRPAPGSSRALVFFLAFGALLLGVGVAVYILALVRTR